MLVQRERPLSPLRLHRQDGALDAKRHGCYNGLCGHLYVHDLIRLIYFGRNVLVRRDLNDWAVVISMN